MSRILATSAGFFSRFASVRFLAASREVRGTEQSPTRGPEVLATIDVRESQSSRGASIIAADRDHHAERLDAVAGSEFVDDRIRLRE